MKKGQITIFILMGIIILFAVFILVYVNALGDDKSWAVAIHSKITSQQLDPVEEHVQECIKETGMKGLQILGAKGGYIYSRDKTLELLDYKISYYDKNEKLLTSVFSRELKRYMDENLNLCLNFTKFTDKTITTNKADSIPTITQKGVGFTLKDYGLTIIKGKSKVVIDSPSINIPVRLYDIAQLGNKLIEEECFSEDNLFMENDLYVEGKKQQEDYNLYSIEDKEMSYLFGFMVKC